MEHLPKKDIALVKNSVRAAIRKSFTRSEYYKAFLEIHRIEWYKGKRLRVSFKCAACSQKFSGSEIQVDHISQIGKGVYNGPQDAERFYKLVFCSYDNLQILCKPCHKIKSAAERKTPSYANCEF